MRGKLEQIAAALPKVRITPAHAGKTTPSRKPACAGSDHPRACGENWISALPCGSFSGSPPRMRGKLDTVINQKLRERITPAHAGKTFWSRRGLLRMTDHPRACGENGRMSPFSVRSSGSPPRMRGKLGKSKAFVTQGRITPAHAGKTLRKWRISVVDPSPQPQSSLTSRKADASSGSQRAPCAAPV